MSSIWNEENQFEDEQPQEEFVEEAYFDEQQAQEQPAGYSDLGQEVLRRIQRAKLYETILNHQLFEPGSADPESIATVEQELKEFIVGRIEVLMGIRADRAPVELTSAEIQVLKALASKVLGTQPAAETERPAPQPQPRRPSRPAPPPPQEPQIRMVQVRQRVAKTNQPSRTVQVGNPPPPARKALARRPKSGNVSSTGQDLSQARPSSGALPMPSPEAINMHTIAQAEAVMQRGKAVIGNEQLNIGTIVKSLK